LAFHQSQPLGTHPPSRGELSKAKRGCVVGEPNPDMVEGKGGTVYAIK